MRRLFFDQLGFLSLRQARNELALYGLGLEQDRQLNLQELAEFFKPVLAYVCTFEDALDADF